MIELFEMEWLFEIATAAVFHCGLFHAVNVVGSDGNDRDMLSMCLELSKSLYHLQAVKHGHIQIYNHQARPVLLGQVESLLPVFSFKHVVSLHFERPLEH